MERVGTLLKKIQEQFAQQAGVEELLLTAKMLEAELCQLQTNSIHEYRKGNVVVTVSCNAILNNITAKEEKDLNKTEEKTTEVLLVDEAEIDAELEQIKRNAETIQKISVQNKPHLIFEDEESIPTLAHQPLPAENTGKVKLDQSSSINDKLRQRKIELGDTLTEISVKDLKKAIGVNDRFLFINELFRGDEIMYERSIKTINSFSILPEAEYWIERELKIKNGWSDDNQIVRQFYQLVKRRFS